MTKNSNNKKAHAFKRAAALITAALMAALVFTGCPQPPTVQKVTITITGDEGVTVNEPKTLEVAKGTKWNEVKAKVKVSYKDGFEAKGFKLDGANGQDLEDGYAFNENKTVFALSKQKGAPAPETVTITVKGDEGITVTAENTLKVDKNSKWQNLKETAKNKITLKSNYGFLEWRLNDKDGGVLTDDYTFAENKTVFALSEINDKTYKVEHLQQNIEDNGYTLKETEEKTGKKGENTAAAAKTYDGFAVQPFSQAAIKADGSTVVQIKYDRNIIALKLNLTGGTTTTPLTDGEGGIKLLKGKYGAKVELTELKKGSDFLDTWTPELPSTFPASSPDTTYVASWTNQCRITVKGDERTAITSDHIKIDPAPAKTWNDIKADVQSKVSLKTEWQGGDYKVYEWRLDDENGTKLTDDYQINKPLTVYAVTNYAKFNNIDNKIKLTSDGKGYTGAAPKGKIIIPDGITEIGGDLFTGAFKDCTEISSIKLPQTLTKIGKTAFAGCTGLTSISLPANLTEIDWYAFSDCTGLTSISMPANLTKIGLSAFRGCAGLTSISLPTNLTEIGRGAFSGCTGLINLTVDSGNMNYKAVDNIIYTKNGKTLVAAAGGLKTVSILNTITTIDGSAFEGAKLESIDLSALTSLTKINDSTFKLCTSLTEVKLPVNLTKIESSAFDGCTSLTGVLDLSALTSLTEIRGSAFNGCTGLAEVKLPASLTKIYPYAFSYCTSLTSAVFADKNGWAVYNDYKYENKAADIQQSDLDDPSKAAKYLRESTYNGGYCDTYWKRN